MLSSLSVSWFPKARAVRQRRGTPRLGRPGASTGGLVEHRFPRYVGQISPDKNMHFHCTTAPFTLPTLDHRASLSCASSPPGQAFYDVSVRQLAALLQASSRPPLTGWPLPFASSCRLIKDLTVILLQGTFTPSVHAHAGRTK